MTVDFAQASIGLKMFRSHPDFKDLDRNVVHMRLAKVSKQGGLVDETFLQRIHDGLAMRILSTAVSPAGEVEGKISEHADMFDSATADYDRYRAAREAFENQIWPELYARMHKNPGMAQFMLEFGIWSDYVARFLVNVWHCPAKAVLPAHGVAETWLEEPAVIPTWDPMFPFCYDQSYRMIQYRTEVPQKRLRTMQNVLFLGGGLVPELWTNEYPLQSSSQHVVVYDENVMLPSYLERIFGKPLGQVGIDYRCDKFERAFSDTAQRGFYDGVVINGVMSYNLQRLDVILSDIAKLLKPGGKVFFDVQLSHPVLMFDVLVLDWPATMETIGDYHTAVKLIQPPLMRAGFVNAQFTTEPYNAAIGESPAGLIVVAEKKA